LVSPSAFQVSGPGGFQALESKFVVVQIGQQKTECLNPHELARYTSHKVKIPGLCLQLPTVRAGSRPPDKACIVHHSINDLFIRQKEYTCVDRRIILKWIFRKWDVGSMDWIDVDQDRDR